MKTRASMLTTEQVMHREVVVLTPSQDIAGAVDTLLRHQVSGAPVVHEDRVVGMFTEHDGLAVLAGLAYEKDPVGTVGDHMHVDYHGVAPDTDLFTLAERFLDTRLRLMPVVDRHSRLLGMVMRADVMRGLQRLATPPVPHHEPQNLFERAAERLADG